MKVFCKKLADTFRKLTLGLAIGGAALSSPFIAINSASAQGVPAQGLLSINTITLPFTTLDGTVTSTNLAQGWSSFVTNTLISTTWNSSSNAFISVTNTAITTNTTFADCFASQQKDLAVIAKFQLSAAGTNTLTFARFMDSNTVDTNNTATVVAGATGAGYLIDATNFPSTWIGGWTGVRLITVAFAATGGGASMTNNQFFKYEVKKVAF